VGSETVWPIPPVTKFGNDDETVESLPERVIRHTQFCSDLARDGASGSLVTIVFKEIKQKRIASSRGILPLTADDPVR